MEIFQTILTVIEKCGVWVAIIGVALYIIIDKARNKSKIDRKKAENQNSIDIQKVIAEHDEKFLETVIATLGKGGIHTVEDERHNVKMNEYIDDALQCLLDKTGGQRAYVFSYHNGERSIDGRGFQKMTCTNERTSPWIAPIMPQSQNLQRAMLPLVYKTLTSQDTFYVENIKSLRETDPITFATLTSHGAKRVFIHSLKRGDGLVTGFIALEYVNDVECDIGVIDEYLEKKALKIMGATLGNVADNCGKAGED